MDSSTTQTHTLDWGLTHYKEALTRQKNLVEARIEGRTGNTLVFTEHHPVYTLGSRKDAATHLLWDERKRLRMGVDLHSSNRGGDVTYHGPGQIVGYAIVDLSNQKDLHTYLRELEQVIIRTLSELSLRAERREGLTGIWVGSKKIAAMGVAVRKWVTYHGFALNVNVDLTPFSGIIPCGITADQGTVTSMQLEMGTQGDLTHIKSTLTKHFWNTFEHE